MAQIITAQHCDVKRNHTGIMNALKVHAKMAHREYMYRWPVKLKGGGKAYVEGPTIKLANDLARIYGNCRVDTWMYETATHYVFSSTFTDYETGYQLNRMFKQRKGQTMGLKDADRQEDIVFQIGQSKSIRNVVVNALRTYADFMMEEAQDSLLDWIEGNQDKARARLVEHFAALQIDMARVNRVIGRPAEKWLVPDMARLQAEIQSIQDGMADGDDLYPVDDLEAADLKDAADKKPTPEREQQPVDEAAEPDKTEDKPPAETKAQKAAAAKAKKAAAAKAKKEAAAKKDKPADTDEVVDPDTGEVTEPEPAATEPEPDQGNNLQESVTPSEPGINEGDSPPIKSQPAEPEEPEGTDSDELNWD